MPLIAPDASKMNRGGDSGRAIEEWRAYVEHILKTPVFMWGFIFVILTSVVLLILETDCSVDTGPPDNPLSGICPLWLAVTNKLIIVFFLAEVCARIFVHGRSFFDTDGQIDFVIVIADSMLALYDLTLGEAFQITVLKSIRLLRILRIIRFMEGFRELRYMLHGIQSAFSSILWGMMLVSLILLIWAIVAVQVIHPRSRDVETDGFYNNCERCPRAWSSVWNAFLTLSQGILSGSVWSNYDMYIIEKHPATIIVFVASFSTVALAAMNLILAAIVDCGAQAREDALYARTEAARELAAAQREANSRYLISLFKAADEDENGTLSRDELLEGYDKNKQLSRALTDLGYERLDIEVIFDALDPYKTDSVNYVNFVKTMEDSRNLDMVQVLIFIKFAVMHMWKVTAENQKGLKDNQNKIEEKLQNLQDEFSNLLGGTYATFKETSTARSEFAEHAKQQKNNGVKQGLNCANDSHQEQKHFAKSRMRPKSKEHSAEQFMHNEHSTVTVGTDTNDLQIFINEHPYGINKADSIGVLMNRNKELVNNIMAMLQQFLADDHNQQLHVMDQSINLLADNRQPCTANSHDSINKHRHSELPQLDAPMTVFGHPGAAWCHPRDADIPQVPRTSPQPGFL